ncbi:MAG TPA: scyllo-inosose 3-dehydrogenase [bacterium]|nr:scyllo-inosose 3-dehydrogenase [bacterium]
MRGLQLQAEWAPRSGYTVSEFERRTGKVVTGASVWRHPQLRLVDTAEPPLGAKEVRLHPTACGVCGSDVHFYETDKDGYMLYPGLTKFPTIIGHEFSGEIIEVGKDVRGLRAGDLVTVEEMIWCGECVPCRNGWPNQCEYLEELGFTIPGAMAERLVVGAKYCWPLAALEERYGTRVAAAEAGALCEPTSVAYNGLFVRAEGFKPGGIVTVYGTGPIGFAAIALARAAGASRIIAFEVSPFRQELAKKVGADDVYNPVELQKAGTSPHETVLELTKGAGADLQVEAAGAPSITVPEMEQSLAIGGKVVIIGRAAERAPLYLEHYETHAGQIYGAQGHSGYGTFQNVIRLMASGRVDMRPVITSRFPLAEAAAAVEKASKRQDGKVMVTMI